MTDLQLLILPSAEKALKKVTITIKTKLNRDITQLVLNPKPEYAKKIKGTKAYYIPAGLYRILYELTPEAITVVGVLNSRDL
jgi:mRNA-degrading endonuclease RelE of RelBE toxin-antitoxin system